MRFWSLTLGFVVAAGCASTPLKQKVSNGHQTVRAALTAFDDAERALCAPDPATPNHCTNAAAATAGLTDAKHQAISRAMADAYQKDEAVAVVLIAWKSGDPVPADVPTVLADANAALAVAQSLAPTNSLVQKATAFLTAAQQLLLLLGGAL